jgi:hypothetical protein
MVGLYQEDGCLAALAATFFASTVSLNRES